MNFIETVTVATFTIERYSCSKQYFPVHDPCSNYIHQHRLQQNQEVEMHCLFSHSEAAIEEVMMYRSVI